RSRGRESALATGRLDLMRCRTLSAGDQASPVGAKNSSTENPLQNVPLHSRTAWISRWISPRVNGSAIEMGFTVIWSLLSRNRKEFDASQRQQTHDDHVQDVMLVDQDRGGGDQGRPQPEKDLDRPRSPP